MGKRRVKVGETAGGNRAEKEAGRGTGGDGDWRKGCNRREDAEKWKISGWN